MMAAAGSSPSSTTVSELRDKYDLRIKTPIHIPWTFTRERPSYFLADVFWLGIMSLCSLIFSSRLLVKLRSRLDIVVGGAEETLDFSNLSPPEIVSWLKDHQNMVQHVIDRGNTQIHLLAHAIDPLPTAIAKPSYATFLVAATASVYILFRFWILHRHWRYNNYPIVAVYLLIHLFSFYTKMNTSVAIHVAVFWCLPALTLASVVLHKMLGEQRAWQNLVVGLELLPKKDDVVLGEKGGQGEHDCACGEISLR